MFVSNSLDITLRYFYTFSKLFAIFLQFQISDADIAKVLLTINSRWRYLQILTINDGKIMGPLVQ